MNIRIELVKIRVAAEALLVGMENPVVTNLGKTILKSADEIEGALKPACDTSQPRPHNIYSTDDVLTTTPNHKGNADCAAAQPKTSKPIIKEVVAVHNERKAIPEGDFTLGKVRMQELIRSACCCTIYGAVKLIAAQPGGVASLAELLGVEESAICRAAHAETVKPVIAGMKKRFSLAYFKEENMEAFKADCQAILDANAPYTVRAALGVLADHEIPAKSLSTVLYVCNQSVLNMLNRPDTTPEFDEKFNAVFTIKEAAL